ncbi:hypothetical protein [Demequina silvatica]|uniref:hypothetical protein n=1 Tax=Demequina silvatica TaxID=1638988 RepID=UPI0012E003ED|nr:hypothetical protein [Demequina silvatica]
MSMYFVDDVIVGDGPELTAADIDPDFADILGGDMCGELTIDVDHAAGLVTVTGAGDGCAVSLAGVMVFFLNGPVVEDVTMVSDGLFGGVDFFQEFNADWQFGFDAGWGDPAWFGLDSTGLPTASEIIGGTSVLSLTYGDTLIEDIAWGSGSEGPDVDDVIEDVIEETAVAAGAAAPAAATPGYTG